MEKTSKLNIPCTYCGNDAIPDTDPPVCAEHREMVKKASEFHEPETLKQLEVKDGEQK